jgi:hypothetical protein
MSSHLTSREPLAFPINSEPNLFMCQACSKKVTREHINVWERRSHDHIRAANTHSAQLCDKCKPPFRQNVTPSCAEHIEEMRKPNAEPFVDVDAPPDQQG